MIWICIFLFFSFLGFLLEVVFARATRNPKRDRKCLYLLPLCPVYGLGALFVLALPAPVRETPWLLFLLGGGAATAAEYLAALYYEGALGVPFWDYSHLPLQIHGRVCLLFSALWGLLALGLVYLVRPWVIPFLAGIPAPVTAAWGIAAAADFLYSACLLRRAGHTGCLRWPLAVRLRP